MTTYNTGNPLGSAAAKDLFDNAQNLDFAVNDITRLIWSDRFGRARRTWYGIERLAMDAIKAFGYITLDSFEDGAELTLPNQVLRWKSDGEYYRWDGDFPKVVASGSTPATSGGVAKGAWVAIGDAALRSQISDPDSVSKYPELQISRWRDEGDVRGWGAVGDGVNDDTSAFQDAVTELNTLPGKKLIVPSGTFVISATITCKPILIEGLHGKALVLVRNMGGKAVFDMTTPSTDLGRVIGSVGVEWVVSGADIDTLILGPKDVLQYTTYFLRYFIQNNYCRGENRVESAYSFAWDYSAARWFRIGDCVGANVFSNCIQGKFDIQNDPSTQISDSGFEFDAAGAVLSARLHDNNIGPIKTAVSILNNVFMTAHDNDLIGTLDGFSWTGTSLFNEPKIHHNNINAQRYGIIVDGPDSLSFRDNTIRRHSRGWKGGSDDWYGMKLANVSDLKVIQNTVQPDESNGSYSGTMYGYSMNACSLGTLDGNFVGVGCDKGVALINCTGMNVDNTVSAQNNSADILFSITANTRITAIGQFSLVSSFSGTVLSKDTTIVGAISMLNRDFDLQNTGNVVMERTRMGAAADYKKWRETVAATQLTKSIVSDAGVATNYQIVTRNGASGISLWEVRADRIRINNGPDVISGAGSPEGIVTATKGSQFWRTDSAATTSLYVKETTSGNTGWVAK